MSTYVTVTIELEVHDEKEFRQAAYQRALDDGLGEEEARHYRDEDETSLGDCAEMLFDPGESPPGCTIEQSSGESFGHLNSGGSDE